MALGFVVLNASLSRNHHPGTQDSLQALLQAVFLFAIEIASQKQA